MAEPGEPDRAPAADGGAARLVLGLAGLNVLSFMDRQLLVAVAPLLIEELSLSRAEIGLLVGVSFVVVFAFGMLVAGVLADRWSRPRILAGGLGVWSAATALTGTASAFGPLAAWRALVGVGEATLSPCAVSMIGDRLPSARAGLANGVFYAGIPVGFGLSFALAGSVAPRLGWRACFLMLGALGLLAVPLVLRLGDPPRRGVAGPAGARGLGDAARGVAAALRDRPALGLVILGGATLAYTSASSQHAITWLVEERGFPYARAAFLSAAVLVSAGLVGTIGIGALTDLAGRRRPGGRLVAFALLGALGLAVSLAFYRADPASPVFLPAWFLAQAWLLGWFGPVAATLDEMAPPGRRGSVVGFGLLAINVLGVATGPWVTGLVGDRAGLTAGLTGSLLPAAAGVALFGLVGLARLRRG